MALLEVRNAEKTYYGEGIETHVLRGLSFSIDTGEFVSIMGASGSGKSTLLYILGFLETLTGGEYYFKGRRADRYDEEEMAKIRNQDIGFVFQQFNLLPQQTIYENVMLPLMYSGVPAGEWRARVEEMVELVGLSHRIDYRTYKLSGGEKQRVAIARALVTKPSVIFADEPTGNLDSRSSQTVMQMIQTLHDVHGHTVLLITHDRFIAEHADRLITIHDGTVASDELVTERRDGGTSRF